MFQQRHVLRVIGGDVCLQQHRLTQRLLYLWMTEGVLFKLFTGYTPVGVQIDPPVDEWGVMGRDKTYRRR